MKLRRCLVGIMVSTAFTLCSLAYAQTHNPIVPDNDIQLSYEAVQEFIDSVMPSLIDNKSFERLSKSLEDTKSDTKYTINSGEKFGVFRQILFWPNGDALQSVEYFSYIDNFHGPPLAA